MTTDSNISLVTKNTVFFSNCVCETISDMTGIAYKPHSDVFTDNEISLQQGFLVLIPFSGKIQGNFYLCMDEKVAASLCGLYKEGMSVADLQKTRSDYSSFMLEVINCAAAKSISHLENEYRPLFSLPPYVIYGKAEMPNVTSGDIIIKGEKGTVQCALSVDLAKLRNEEKDKAVEAQPEVAAVASAMPMANDVARALVVQVKSLAEKVKDINRVIAKSKLVYMEDANKSLIKLVEKAGLKSSQTDEIILGYQLIEKGLKMDDGNFKEEMAAIAAIIQKMEGILAQP
jgi:CheY-specific phosphatase CheX